MERRAPVRVAPLEHVRDATEAAVNEQRLHYRRMAHGGGPVQRAVQEERRLRSRRES